MQPQPPQEGMYFMKNKKEPALIRNIKQHWELYLLILPVILYFAIFKYGPMYGIQIAFRDYYPGMGYLEAEWVGFDNFIRFFNSYQFKSALWNTFSISLLNLVLGFPLPIILALVMNSLRSNMLKKSLQTLSYAPHFISSVCMAGIILTFTSERGIINEIVAVVGGNRVSFMSEPSMFKWVYVLSRMWKEAGWGSVMYIAALSSVDLALYEAADVDGASRLQKIWYVDLPSILPTIVIMLILRCGQILNLGYEDILMLQNDLNLSGSQVISTYSYQIGLLNQDYSYSTAIGMFNSIINLILLTSVNFISRKVNETSLW